MKWIPSHLEDSNLFSSVSIHYRDNDLAHFSFSSVYNTKGRIFFPVHNDAWRESRCTSVRTNKTVTSIAPTASADCCRRMKIPLRICSFHLFFSLSACVCVPLLFLSVDPKPRLRRATLLHKRGKENAGRPGNAPSPPALSSSIYSDPIVVCRIVSTTAGAAPPHTHKTQHAQPRKAKDVARTCLSLFLSLFFSALRVSVFLSNEARRAEGDEILGGAVG